jgi:hypothetical protein
LADKRAPLVDAALSRFAARFGTDDTDRLEQVDVEAGRTLLNESRDVQRPVARADVCPAGGVASVGTLPPDPTGRSRCRRPTH